MKAIRTCGALLLFAAVTFVPSEAAAEESAVSTKSQVFELPQSIGAGEGKEVSVLLDESHLKLATVVLRHGTTLPAHSTPVPATILVLEGKGVIHVGSEAVPVSKGTLLTLAAGEEHDVVPAPDTNMLLLVHYLRSASAAASPPPADHAH
jgi:quercetin dioxygenase-like cupin family protein